MAEDIDEFDDLDELEIAIDEDEVELDSVPPALPGVQSAPPPLSPPPLADVGSKTESLLSWTGKTPFQDLFVPDSAPLPPSRGGVEDKIAYLREKLKRAEAQSARFKESWELRESETDHLEDIYHRSLQRLDDELNEKAQLTSKLTALEGYLDQKKREVEEYGARVSEALSQREQSEAALRDELASARAQAARELSEKSSETDEARAQSETLRGELQAERDKRVAVTQDLDDKIRERDSQIESLETSVSDLEQDKALGREEIAQNREAFELDLKARNEAYATLKSTHEAQSEALADRETRILSITEALESEIDGRREDIHQLETRLENLNASLASRNQEHSELEAKLKDVLEQTQKVKDGLEGKVEELQHSGEQKDLQLGQRAEELAAERRRIESLHNELAGLNETVSNRDAMLGRAESEIQDLEGGLRDLRADFSTSVDARDEAIEKLKTSVSSSHAEVTRLEGDLEQARAQIRQEKMQSAEHRKHAGDLIGRARKVLEDARHGLSANAS